MVEITIYGTTSAIVFLVLLCFGLKKYNERKLKNIEGS